MAQTQIMIVEDERIVALNLKQRLVKLGYDVCAMATSGAGALEDISRTRPDVVLMDINIEGDIDGIETVSRIPPETHTPVIYLTAYSEKTTLERAQATKPYGYLLKPFSERELHATIQMVLARRDADSALRQSERRLETLVAERTSALTTANQELERQILERAKAEAALAQAQKVEAIGQLTGGIAHDFNNLLQGIGGSLSILQKRIAYGQYGDVDRLVNAAISSTEKAASLTHRLLAFSRRQPLTPQTTNCSALLNGMHEMLARTLGESVEIKTNGREGLWLTRCDANQLESAILNLAINARDAMPDGGAVTLETSNFQVDNTNADAFPDVEAGQFVCITVGDVGIGMTADVMARAFDPFYTTKPLGQGTGLGLSMVYGFARQSGGTAKIESEPGRGTRVKILLPRTRAELEAKDQGVIPNSYQPPHYDKTVLVVEDDAIVRNVVVEVLKDLGCEVLEARDGLAGLEMVKASRRIDLLVSDIGLPGLNGRQLAESARAVRPDLRILLMTGYAESAIGAEGFLTPGMDLMIKPFALDAFSARVQRMMD